MKGRRIKETKKNNVTAKKGPPCPISPTLDFESARVRVHAAEKHNLDRLRAEKENINQPKRRDAAMQNVKRKT